jgi:hypothetical protein
MKQRGLKVLAQCTSSQVQNPSTAENKMKQKFKDKVIKNLRTGTVGH